MPIIQIFALSLVSIILSLLVTGISQLLITGKFHILWSRHTNMLIACSMLTYIFAFQTILPAYPAYLVCITALLISMHTDLNHQLISRFVSLYLIPVGLLASYANLLPICWTQSLITSIVSAALLYSINKVFYFFKRHDGLGQGDVELFAFIGAWIGALGCWFVIVVSSTLGTLTGCFLMLYSGKKIKLLPFGPFLAIAAILYLFFSQNILNWLV